MFGTFRFVLAQMVVLGHLWPVHGLQTHVFAVFCFYLLSGYLMTLVLTTRYGFSPRGTLRFLANRGLRIYPPYLVVLLLNVLLVLAIPKVVLATNVYLRLPADGLDWLRNLFIFGLVGETLRLVPPSWSLDVELFFYLAMALLLARRPLIAWAWFGAGVLYTVHLVMQGATFGERYVPYAAASLPFSIGALLAHHRDRLARVNPLLALPFAVLFLLNALLADVWWTDPRTGGFYASLAIGACLVACLSRVEPSNLPAWVVRSDRFLGDLSYPIFLCHWTVAVVIVAAIGGPEWRTGGVVFACGVPLATGLAWAIHRGVERPVEGLRTRIRSRQSV